MTLPGMYLRFGAVSLGAVLTFAFMACSDADDLPVDSTTFERPEGGAAGASAELPLEGGFAGRGAGGALTRAVLVECEEVVPTIVVGMTAAGFTPDSVGIAEANVVQFENTDTTEHTSTSGQVADGTPEPDGIWDTGVIAPDESACVRFLVPGEYPFYCELQPEAMQGEVLVQLH